MASILDVTGHNIKNQQQQQWEEEKKEKGKEY